MARTVSSIVDGSAGVGSTRMPNVNPSDLDDIVVEVAAADARVAEDAVASAVAAWPGWARTSPLVRSEIIDRAGSEIIARADELGDLLAREEGKTLAEARGEALRSGQMLKFAAGQALSLNGIQGSSIRSGVEVFVTRRPVGVVGVLTPFNFPLAIPALKIGPALALGNAVVFKPADQVTACAWELVDILHRAGVPPGVLNMVLGNSAVTGPVLTGHSQVAAVTFTGSVPTGRLVRSSVVDRGGRVQLELGGKNPLVVLADADLDLAVDLAVQGGWGSTGQRCSASSFLVVADAVHDRFVYRVEERRRALRVGDARAVDTDMGPVIDEVQLSRNAQSLAQAGLDGGQVSGGEILERSTRGHYQAPALVVGTEPDHAVNRHEVFGPVISVIRVADYEEALVVANASPYPLSAAIVTRDLASATHFRHHSVAGMVMVNLSTAGVDHNVPFGGAGNSSYGPREQGAAAWEFFTESRTHYVAAGSP